MHSVKRMKYRWMNTKSQEKRPRLGVCVRVNLRVINYDSARVCVYVFAGLLILIWASFLLLNRMQQY